MKGNRYVQSHEIVIDKFIEILGLVNDPFLGNIKPHLHSVLQNDVMGTNFVTKSGCNFRSPPALPWLRHYKAAKHKRICHSHWEITPCLMNMNSKVLIQFLLS